MVSEGSDLKEKLRRRESAVQRQEEENRMENAKYNKVYKKIREEGKMPEYLKQVNFSRIGKGKEE